MYTLRTGNAVLRRALGAVHFAVPSIGVRGRLVPCPEQHSAGAGEQRDGLAADQGL